MSATAAGDVFLQLSDRRLRARWYGRVAATDAESYAPTLVFLHEGLGSVELWRTFPAALCARTGLRGFAFDRTGYGRSSPWPASPAARYMEIESDLVLPQALDAAGIEACLLIGHSDGGTIALSFAAAQPPLVRGLVTIGAHVVSEARTLTSIRHAREAFLSTDLRARLARYHGDNVDDCFWLWNDAWLEPGFEPMAADTRLPRVRVPVLAVQGEHDEYGTLKQLSAISRGVSGRCETRLMTGCGHAPHLQDEPTMVEVVARFVATLGRGPASGASPLARALSLAAACVLGATAVFAQPDPCVASDAQAVLSGARQELARMEDAAGAERLRAVAEPPGPCHEVGLAALAVAGWAEARQLASLGGPPGELGRIRDLLARLELVRTTRPATSVLSQLASYADAILRAAVAAAQDERDEMQVYLTHARTLADSLRLAGVAGPWPLPLEVVAGELWLEVDRFAEARDALSGVADGPLADRASASLGPALERLGDQRGACAAYARVAASQLAMVPMARAREGLERLGCSR